MLHRKHSQIMKRDYNGPSGLWESWVAPGQQGCDWLSREVLSLATTVLYAYIQFTQSLQCFSSYYWISMKYKVIPVAMFQNQTLHWCPFSSNNVPNFHPSQFQSASNTSTFYFSSYFFHFPIFRVHNTITDRISCMLLYFIWAPSASPE